MNTLPVIRRALGGLAVLVLLLGAPASFAAFRTAGNVVAVTTLASGADFRLASGALARVEFAAAGTLRVRFAPDGVTDATVSPAIAPGPRPQPAATVFDLPEVTYVVGGEAIAVVLKQPLQIVIVRSDGSLVSADLADGIGWDDTQGYTIARKFALAGERYFGLGLRGGPLDRRGRSFNNFNVDWSGYGEFTDPLYSSTPYFYGMFQGKTYGLFVDNPARPFFDFDTQANGILTFGTAAGELDYYLYVGPTPQDVAAAHAALTGSNPLPPKWTLGYHQSRFGYRSATELIDLAHGFRNLAVPCDAIYLDLHYMDKLQFMSWDPLNFPDPLAMNRQLDELGFRRVNILDPALRVEDRLWDYFAASGFFLTGADGQPLVNSIFLGNVSWIDFTKPAAREFLAVHLPTFLATGVSALWIDLNEPAQNFMPEARYDFDGAPRTDAEARNLYALIEARFMHETQQAARPNVRPWNLSRAGYPGIQRYAANWSGDNLSTYDSLRVSVQLSNSMAVSGQNQFGHDIGGFLGSPGAELFVRWMQFAAYTPFMRNHAVDSAARREPWSFGEPYLSQVREAINERYRHLPYLYSLYDMAASTGAPVLAPLWFHFPQDAATHTVDLQFMFGPNLLVAPVVEADTTLRQVYLPAGAQWVDTATGTVAEGGQVVVTPAALERIPVFVRVGAVIPKGPVLQYVDAPAPPGAAADIMLGSPGRFTLYEDDGISLAYRQGEFLRTEIAHGPHPDGYAVSIRRIAGNLLPPARPWQLRLFRAGAPAAVTLNGVALAAAASASALAEQAAGYFFDVNQQSLSLRFADAAGPLEIVLH